VLVQALRDSTVNVVEKMNEMIELIQASSSVCQSLHQGKLSAVSMGPQEAQAMPRFCSQSLALPKRVAVVGLDAGRYSGCSAWALRASCAL